MEKKKGYRIAQYEQNMPAEATIEEVRYNAKGGQKVNFVIGWVTTATGKSLKVTWDDEGLCRKYNNNERLQEYDLNLEGGT